MTRRRLVWFTAGWLGLVATGLGQDNDSRTKALADLQGAWKLAALERRGEVREFTDKAPYWFVKGDKVLYGGETLATMTLDATTTPPCLDLAFRMPTGEKEGIYTLRDGAWKICLNWLPDGVKERPQDFAIKDKPNHVVLTFQRAKLKEAEAAAGGLGFAGIALGRGEEGALFVKTILPGSPAKQAGLAKDDQLLQLDGNAVGSLLDTVQAIQQARPGSTLVLRIDRAGKEMEVRVKVGLRPFRFLVD